MQDQRPEPTLVGIQRAHIERYIRHLDDPVTAEHIFPGPREEESHGLLAITDFA